VIRADGLSPTGISDLIGCCTFLAALVIIAIVAVLICYFWRPKI
jgi:hypothetical protein